MRLSDVLSKPPKNGYKQVEGFLVNKQGNVGQMVKLQAGTVSLNFFCECCDDLLSKAELAYREELGAGSIVYLRKIFEKITVQTANAVSIQVLKPNGRQRPFKELLEEVDKQCHIVPPEFSANGYRLFGELSDVVHGDFDEQLGLTKFEPLYRLVIGILENVRNREELSAAKKALGWSEDGEEDT